MRVCADEPPARRPLDTVWDQLSAADRDRVAGQLSWPRSAGVCQRTARPELASAMADQIPRFLDGAELPSRPPVLLHTEVTRQHLLNAEGDSWFLTRTRTPTVTAATSSARICAARYPPGASCTGTATSGGRNRPARLQPHPADAARRRLRPPTRPTRLRPLPRRLRNVRLPQRQLASRMTPVRRPGASPAHRPSSGRWPGAG